jgi:hypothetical protein
VDRTYSALVLYLLELCGERPWALHGWKTFSERERRREIWLMDQSLDATAVASHPVCPIEGCPVSMLFSISFSSRVDSLLFLVPCFCDRFSEKGCLTSWNGAVFCLQTSFSLYHSPFLPFFLFALFTYPPLPPSDMADTLSFPRGRGTGRGVFSI